MAISASFYRNVSLLTELVPPSENFKQHFREGMFDKPNTAGFLHTSHYLLTVYDSKRFKKLCEWPVTCKKTEAKYRNNVKTFLTIISTENPDVEFPNILFSHLFHAGGSKFVIIMWKLSQVVLRKYITSTSIHNVMFVPQVGIEENVGKIFLKKTYAKICSNITDQRLKLVEMENTANTFLKKEEQKLNDTKTEIFETEQVIKTLADNAPVYCTIKNALADINNEDVIQMWKSSIQKSVNYLQDKNSILKRLKELSQKVNDLVLSKNSDIQTLDANQYQKINYLEMPELFPYNMKTILLQQLYTNEKLNLHNFFLLFNSVLTQLCQRLKLNLLEDLSVCRLQTETSRKDITEDLNIFQMYLSDVETLTSETRQKLCNILHQNNIVQICDHLDVSPINNVLLMSTPSIKIDTDSTDVEINPQNCLLLTPVGAIHRPLFRRYEHLKSNHLEPRSKLRENLFASHTNLDDSTPTITIDTPSLHVLPVSSKKKLLSSKQAEKYSRLFSTRTKRNNSAAIASVVSVPCTNKEANSTAIANTIEGLNDISELSLNMSGTAVCDKSIEFTTPIKLTIAKDYKSEDATESEHVVPNVLDICEKRTTETNQQRRRSISDLVERYKKLLDRNDHTSD